MEGFAAMANCGMPLGRNMTAHALARTHYQLGMQYITKGKREEAFEQFLKAYELGHQDWDLSNLCGVAQQFWKDSGPLNNHESRAIKLYEIAARFEDNNAMLSLYEIYASHTVSKNLDILMGNKPTSVIWLEKAARNGNAQAILILNLAKLNPDDKHPVSPFESLTVNK